MKRALLISVQGIGNTVLITPVVRLLAEAGYQVDVIVSDNGSHEILNPSQYVSNQYVWIERDGWVKNVFRLSRRVRGVRYDIAYAMYPNGRRENALLFLTRASRKVSYIEQKYPYRLLGFLPFIRKIWFQRRHDVVSNLNLIGANGSHPSSGRPDVFLPRRADEFAERFFDSHDLRNKVVVAMHPGGANSSKKWSEEKYIDLGMRLSQNPEIRLLIFGGSAENDEVGRIASAVKNGAVPVCDLGLNEVSALLQRSRLLIGNDSALVHIASALGVPVVAIWGYTDFYRTAPFSSKGLIIRIDYPCSPCYEFARGYIKDCQYHLKCIKNISAEHVYRIVERYLSLLNGRQHLSTRAFADETCVESVRLLEGGCLMVNVSASTDEVLAISPSNLNSVNSVSTW